MIAREDIYKTARKWVGVPFRHQGRTDTGIDCIGLIKGVAGELGCHIELPDNYSPSPSGMRVMEDADKLLVKPARQGFDKMLPGDVMVVWGYQAGVPQHFAFIGSLHNRLTMIHAFQRAEKVCEHYMIDWWKDRYVATYCIPGTENIEG